MLPRAGVYGTQKSEFEFTPAMMPGSGDALALEKCVCIQCPGRRQCRHSTAHVSEFIHTAIGDLCI